jgi:hypothetical protein
LYIPVILALGRLRQENFKVKVSLGYIVKPCFRTITKRQCREEGRWKW